MLLVNAIKDANNRAAAGTRGTLLHLSMHDKNVRWSAKTYNGLPIGAAVRRFAWLGFAFSHTAELWVNASTHKADAPTRAGAYGTARADPVKASHKASASARSHTSTQATEQARQHARSHARTLARKHASTQARNHACTHEAIVFKSLKQAMPVTRVHATTPGSILTPPTCVARVRVCTQVSRTWETQLGEPAITKIGQMCGDVLKAFG